MEEFSWVELECENKAETPEAVLLDFGDKEVWIPKSQMDLWPEKEEGGIAAIRWWKAYEQDLI